MEQWGVQAIKKMGGTVVTQDEKTSEFYGMPSAATGSPASRSGPALLEFIPIKIGAGMTLFRRSLKSESQLQIALRKKNPPEGKLNKKRGCSYF